MERQKKEKKNKKKKGGKKQNKNKEADVEQRSLSEFPAEILVQIFDEVEDPLALWTLRCTCKVFNNIIASFPVLGYLYSSSTSFRSGGH